MALIICDLDGTLLQAQLITVPAVQRTFAAFGFPEPDAATICSFLGRPVETYHRWLADTCGPAQAAEIIAATDRRELDLIGSEGQLYPGVSETLGALRTAGHVLAAASNAPSDYFMEAFRAHRLSRYFTTALCRGYGHADKRAMIRAILDEHTDRPAIMVGDRNDDVESARANRIMAVGAGYGFGADGELDGADAVINAFDELLAAVERLAP